MKTNLLATLVCFVIGIVFLMISKKIWVKLQDVRRRMKTTTDNWVDTRVEDDLHFSFFIIRLLGQGSLILGFVIGFVMLVKSLKSLLSL